MKSKKKITRIVSLGLNYFQFREFDAQFLNNNKTDIVRLNFSHIDYRKAEECILDFRKNFPNIKILQDLQGQKWRVGKNFLPKEKLVQAGEQVYFCSTDKYIVLTNNNPENLYIPIEMEGDFSILRDVKKILVKDGLAEFTVLKNMAIEKEIILVQAKNSVIIRAEKSINIPDVAKSELSAMTAKDKNDLEWGIEKQVDIVCLSFVNKADDIIEIKKFIQAKLSANQKMPEIWAKIETRDGVENFESILEVADGIILGRGDLIPELGRFESVIAQNQILRKFKKVKNKKKNLIIATHLLDSMMSPVNKLPSISNLNDIYQCILSGATGFMLTNEVGYGKQSKKTIEIFDEYLNFLEEKI